MTRSIGVGERMWRLLLPPDVRLTPAVRARWVAVGGVAAAGIGSAAIAAAVRAAPPGSIPWSPATLDALRIAVPVSAGLSTAAGVWAVLWHGIRLRAPLGVVAGVAVAVLSHPLAWGVAAAAGSGAGWDTGLVAASWESLRAVGAVTVPLCAAGGYWVGRRFTGADCP